VIWVFVDLWLQCDAFATGISPANQSFWRQANRMQARAFGPTAVAEGLAESL
jgi:hypothetical protein